MSVIRLMLLGFFMEKPNNAYEIKKEVEKRNFTWWVKGSTPSIYRNIKSLADQGYLDGQAVREGEMPEKTVYTINEAGKTCFRDLMAQYAGSPPPIYLDFTAVISNLSKLQPEDGLRLIGQMHHSFQATKEILETLENVYEPYPAKAILRLSIQMYGLFCDWLEQVQVDFIKKEPS